MEDMAGQILFANYSLSTIERIAAPVNALFAYYSLSDGKVENYISIGGLVRSSGCRSAFLIPFPTDDRLS
jgi:hypothetical protein